MSSAEGTSTFGDAGPDHSEGPPTSADGGGGMSSSKGTSTFGDPGPDHSQGPTATEKAYAQGRHDQRVEDREPLQREDPVTHGIEAIASKGASLVDKAAEWLSDRATEGSHSDNSTRDSSPFNGDTARSDAAGADREPATSQDSKEGSRDALGR